MKRASLIALAGVAAAIGVSYAGSNGVGTGGLQGFPTVTTIPSGATLGPGCVVTATGITCAGVDAGNVNVYDDLAVGDDVTIGGDVTVASGGGITVQGEDKLLVKIGSGSYTPSVINGLFTRTTAVGNVGGGTDTLQTVTIPANSLTTTGHCWRLQTAGTVTNNANAKNFTWRFGGTNMLNVTIPINTGARFFAEATVCRIGTSSQTLAAELRLVDTTLNTVVNDFTANTTMAVTESGTIVIDATATATTTDDVVQTVTFADVH